MHLSVSFKVRFKSRGILSEELAIGEVAHRAGIRPSALRYYESIGLLPQPRRVSGRRRYDASTVQLLKVIQLAQTAGFTIAGQINASCTCNCAGYPACWPRRPLASQKLLELDAPHRASPSMKRILENGLNCRSLCDLRIVRLCSSKAAARQ